MKEGELTLADAIQFAYTIEYELIPGGGGVIDISLGGEVRPGPTYPDPF